MFDGVDDIRQTRKKYKELIALGIGICEKCYGCIEYHVTAALQQ